MQTRRRLDRGEPGKEIVEGLHAGVGVAGRVLKHSLQVDEQLPCLPFLTFTPLILRLGKSVVEEEFAKALDWQYRKASLTGLNEVGKPGHSLVGALPLQDVKQEVRLPAPAEEVAKLVVRVHLLQLIQNRSWGTSQRAMGVHADERISR